MSYLIRGARRGIVKGVALYAALIGVAWCALFPILWAMSGSLKKESDVATPALLPSHPQWSNFGEVFALMPFWRMFANTVFYAGCVTAGQVFSDRTKVFHEYRCLGLWKSLFATYGKCLRLVTEKRSSRFAASHTSTSSASSSR